MLIVRRGLVGTVALLVAVFLLAAACSSDDSGEEAVTADGDSEDEAPDEEEAEELPDDTEDSADDSAASEDETEEPSANATDDSEVPEELPASFRGVTPTSIKVGVAVPDFDALAQYGIPNYQGSAEIAFQPFIDAINEGGGIYGRQIEPVYITYDFLDPTTQEIACTQFAEDEEVFIVLYGLLSEQNLCLTDLNDVMVMTEGFQTAALREQSGDTLWLNLNAADDAGAVVMGATLAEGGFLDGKTIAILDTTDSETLDPLAETLAEYGFESLPIVLESDGTDPIAQDAELAVVAEVLRSEGVDFVFDVVGGGWTALSLANAGFAAETAYIALDAVIEGVDDPSIVDGALTVSQPANENFWFEDPEFKETCIDPIVEANPDIAEQFDVLPDADAQAQGEPNWALPTFTACNSIRLLEALGEIAGAELTNDSFRSALDELADFELIGYGQASFRSADKWDGLDEFQIQRYNHDEGTIEIVGEPVLIDR